MASSPLPVFSRPRSTRFVGMVIAGWTVMVTASCELRSTPAPITVYSPALQVSFPLPQGWSADQPAQQGGFHMQTFTGRSVDVPDRAGIRAQVLAGPTPDQPIDDVAERFRRDLDAIDARDLTVQGRGAKMWRYVSADGEESSQLLLMDVDERLYGLFVRGEARTLEAYQDALDNMFSEFSLEQGPYFDAYEAPGGDVVIKHPRSWERTQAAAKPGESLFVGFRSAPLAVEQDGTTVHATLEVTVNKLSEEIQTVEAFYAARTEVLGDTYRLLKHETMEDVGAISTLYLVETQLASYLERTVYFVHDGKSFIYKFNARNQVYYAVEGWIDEIVRSFFGESQTGTADGDVD